MDAYDATKIVYSRIQGMDPENAAKIMGLLLIQDHGEKEMIRLAFGPEVLLHSLVLKARKDLGLLSPTPPSPSPFAKQQQPLTPSSSRLPSPSSWAPAPIFSRTNSSVGDEDDLLGSGLHYGGASPFYGGGDLIDELQLQEQLSFISDNVPHSPKDLFYPDLASEWGGAGWGHHRRACSVADLYDGFAWKPCLYFAKGFCKNGSACRFQHGLQDDAKVDPLVEHELLLRSKSQRLTGSLGSAAAAASFAYGSSLPSPTSGKCMNFLLQQQQSESQRVAAAAASLMFDEPHKFMGRSRIDFATMVNPGSRQIYLTFPADSTFREEDVSNYFSIYGPVQDVRIPYQQKRMFGFVTFVYPETVKLILAKGNPHFVCDARVLVKPYKEKGKLPDKKHQQLDRGDFSGGSTPTVLDSRDPYELQQLGARYLFNNSQEAFLRRKLEEQQQAADLQQAIELQSRRFMGLQLLDLKNRGLRLSTTSLQIPSPISTTPTTVTTPSTTITSPSAGDSTSSDDNKCSSPVATTPDAERHATVNPTVGEEESIDEKSSPNQDSNFEESVEDNLPDSPFACPVGSSCFNEVTVAEAIHCPTSVHGSARLLPADTASFKSYFLPMPSFSPSHGAIGM